MNPATNALATRLARFDRLVEVGIGLRTDVAARLAKNTAVTATDIHSCTVPEGIAFVRDDITTPAIETYADADCIYALNLPPELHRPTRTVAREVGAEFLFTTLGGEFPAIPTESETLPGETLFRATNRRSKNT
ncbi:MAG TPA: UPF0146 family protein, partial [Halococcus sp.]|nr:UPF0146 family protein [Halococcus sp.]